MAFYFSLATILLFVWKILELHGQHINDGSDIFIVYGENEKVKPLRELFTLKVEVAKRREDFVLTDVYLSFISSPSTEIQAFQVNGQTRRLPKSLTQYSIANLFASKKIDIQLDVIIGQNGDITPGYHVENILVQFKYKKNNVQYQTIFQPMKLIVINSSCDKEFNVENGSLRPDQVTATSYYPHTPPDNFGEQSTGWCASSGITNRKHPYLQILFDHPVRLTSLASASRDKKEFWLTEYSVAYVSDEVFWVDYKEQAMKKVLKGDRGFPEYQNRHWFKPPIHTSGIRIFPIKKYGKSVCARFSVKGCYLSTKDTCTRAIGLSNNTIVPDQSFSDMNPLDDFYSTPYQARLNYKALPHSYGWRGSEGDYLQVDLGSLHQIKQVAIQGSSSPSLSSTAKVDAYKLQYSNDRETWFTVKDKLGGDVVFSGPESGVLVRASWLPSPIVARSLRFLPLVVNGGYTSILVMRSELYGCLIDGNYEDKVRDDIDQFGLRSILIHHKNGEIFLCQRNLKKTNCFYSRQEDLYKSWTGVPSFILNVVGYDKNNNYYGVTKNRNYAIKLNGTDIWRVITGNHWKKTNQQNYIVKVKSLPNILPAPILLNNTWAVGQGKSVAVSGKGFHTKLGTNKRWDLVLKWSCCGL